MTSPKSVQGLQIELDSVRDELFEVHVPWHRLASVVDLTTDAGALAREVLSDHGDLEMTVVDLTQQVRPADELLADFGDRVDVVAGDILDPLPAGADYYLLPEGLEQLDPGRLTRLFRSVSQACLPRGRAMVCVPVESAWAITMTAERAGLEITRIGTESGAKLIEFGTGLLRVLPGE